MLSILVHVPCGLKGDIGQLLQRFFSQGYKCRGPRVGRDLTTNSGALCSAVRIYAQVVALPSIRSRTKLIYQSKTLEHQI